MVRIGKGQAVVAGEGQMVDADSRFPATPTLRGEADSVEQIS
jgi:hypothetical protein